jgi:hypothetical protein
MLEYIFPYITYYLIADFILVERFPDPPQLLKNIKYIENCLLGLLIYFAFNVLNINLNNFLTILGMIWILFKIMWY